MKNYFTTFLLFVMIGLECFSQGRPISGIVTDSDGAPLPGVNVIIQGTTTGAVTDLEGKYLVNASDADVLQFTFIGYLNENIAVGNQSVIDVAMIEDLIGLSEVVVVGYGTVKKSDVTGALTSISAETLQERPVQNALEAMQGKAAGVDVFSNSRPGSEATIRIRGEKSLTATEDQRQPLYVVDGLIHMGKMNDINPNDIASMEILKDASATAIYGSRGANGVVLITTKKGKDGKVSVNYSGSVTLDNIHSLTDWASSGELLDRKRLSLQNGGLYQVPYADPASDIQRFGNTDKYTISSIRQAYEWNDPGVYSSPKMRPTTAEEQELWGVDEVPVYNSANIPTYDWMDLLTQTGVTNDHNLSISAGTEKSSVYFSFGYLDNSGTQLNQSFERFTSKLNADVKPTDWLKFGTALSVTRSTQDYGSIYRSGSATGAKDLYGLALGMYPMAQPYDSIGEIVTYPGNNQGAPIFNPVIDIDNTLDQRMVNYFQGNFYGEVEFTPWLRYRLNVGTGLRFNKKGEWQGKNSTLLSGSTPAVANASIETDQTTQWMIENLLYADKTFGLHSFGLTLLQSAQSYELVEMDMSAINLINDAPKWNDLGANLNGPLSSYKTGFEGYQMQSYMGRLNYSLMNKYLLTASIRYDASSVLSEGYKWDYFPSASVAWKLEEEDFVKSIPAISQLKLRYGFGVIGNANVDPYVSSGPLTSYDYIYGTVVAKGYIPGDLPNPELGWEKTAQHNVGLDFGFFRSRITGSAEVYWSRITDLLYRRTIPSVLGYAYVWDNVGEMTNNGVEFNVTSVNVSTKDFNWKTNVNFSLSRDKIVELVNGKVDMPGEGLNGNGWWIGEQINVFRTYEIDGLWQDTPEDAAEMEKWQSEGGIKFEPGQYKPVDRNNNYQLEDTDKFIVGGLTPKWIGGMTNTLTYKDFKLSCFVYARVGQSYFANLSPEGVSRESFISYARSADESEFWSEDNPDAKYEKPTIIASNASIKRATYVNDGSYFIVRNISLSYDLPSSLTNRLKMNNCQIYAQVLNPFIFGGEVVKAGVNPDDTNNWNNINSVGDPVGGTNNNTIITKSWVFGVRIGL